jgi:hypothetical protein
LSEHTLQAKKTQRRLKQQLNFQFQLAHISLAKERAKQSYQEPHLLKRSQKSLGSNKKPAHNSPELSDAPIIEFQFQLHFIKISTKKTPADHKNQNKNKSLGVHKYKEKLLGFKPFTVIPPTTLRTR